MGGARSVGGVAASSASAGTAVRSATVTRPELRDLYPPLFEGVVLVVWIGCMVPVVSGLLATTHWPILVALGLAQVLVAVGGLLFSLWYAGGGARLPQRARARLGLELGTQVDRSLRRRSFARCWRRVSGSSCCWGWMPRG